MRNKNFTAIRETRDHFIHMMDDSVDLNFGIVAIIYLVEFSYAHLYYDYVLHTEIKYFF